MEQKRKRGENWSYEEKEILRQLIAAVSKIIEDKSTKTSTNYNKIKEWKNITAKFNELTGKNRTVQEIKLSWKRMKLSAKKNLSSYRMEVNKTGGGGKPPSPSPEDLEIMAIAPQDFIIELNDYDSDALISASTTTKDVFIDPKPGPSFIDPKPGSNYAPNSVNEENIEHEVIIEMADLSEVPKVATPITKPVETRTGKKRKQRLENRSEEMRQSIVESNIELKKRQLEMMEEEHKYNIKIANLKAKKLELEVTLLEKKVNVSSVE